jgi:hypothetical protein
LHKNIYPFSGQTNDIEVLSVLMPKGQAYCARRHRESQMLASVPVVKQFELLMPRARPVVCHARRYKSGSHLLRKMPPACPVEFSRCGFFGFGISAEATA